MKKSTLSVFLMSIAILSTQVGCSRNRTGVSSSDSPSLRPFHVLPALASCKTPPIVPMQNESGNYGEIDFPGRNKGELLKVELPKDVVCDSKGMAFQEAKGQLYFSGTDLFITAGRVSKISQDAVEIDVSGAPANFRLTGQTEMCGPSKVNAGEMATVTAHAKDDTALSLRSGTMVWRIFDAGGPAHYNCAE